MERKFPGKFSKHWVYLTRLSSFPGFMQIPNVLATAKFVTQAFYKNNVPVVYLFVLHRLAGKCTKIYDACKTIARLIKPLVLRRFRCRCGFCKISAVVVYKVTMLTYQCSVCFYICDLNLEVIEKFQANIYRLPHWKKTVPRKSIPESGVSR